MQICVLQKVKEYFVCKQALGTCLKSVVSLGLKDFLVEFNILLHFYFNTAWFPVFLSLALMTLFHNCS